MTDGLTGILETTTPERLATGFGFTEGPSWHPDGFYYFVDIRTSTLHRVTPGKPPEGEARTVETVRTETGEGNGTTFDLQGRLVMCEGGNRRLTRMAADGRPEGEARTVEVVVDRYEGPGVPAGDVKTTIRLVFRSAERTLGQEEVNREVHRLADELKSELGVTFGSDLSSPRPSLSS